MLKNRQQITSEIMDALSEYELEVFESLSPKDNFLSLLILHKDLKQMPQTVAEIAVILNNSFGLECVVDYTIIDKILQVSVSNAVIDYIRQRKNDEQN